MSADQLAAAARTGDSTNSQAGGVRGSSAAGFERYGLTHPAAADAVGPEDEQQQQQEDRGKSQVCPRQDATLVWAPMCSAFAGTLNASLSTATNSG